MSPPSRTSTTRCNTLDNSIQNFRHSPPPPAPPPHTRTSRGPTSRPSTSRFNTFDKFLPRVRERVDIHCLPIVRVFSLAQYFRQFDEKHSTSVPFRSSSARELVENRHLPTKNVDSPNPYSQRPDATPSRRPLHENEPRTDVSLSTTRMNTLDTPSYKRTGRESTSARQEHRQPESIPSTL